MVRRVLTEVLLDVTDSEMTSLVEEVLARERTKGRAGSVPFEGSPDLNTSGEWCGRPAKNRQWLVETVRPCLRNSYFWTSGYLNLTDISKLCGRVMAVVVQIWPKYSYCRALMCMLCSYFDTVSGFPGVFLVINNSQNVTGVQT